MNSNNMFILLSIVFYDWKSAITVIFLKIILINFE